MFSFRSKSAVRRSDEMTGVSAAVRPDASLEDVDEATLVSRLSAFEAAAWQEVFDRYFTSIYRIAHLRTGDESAAEDIAAQTFAEATEGITRYRYRGVPFRAWLYRIARNLTSDHLKAQRRKPQVALDESLALPAGDDMQAAETQNDFRAALDELTDDQKMVVILRLVDGYSLAEVATLIDKSTGAVKQLQSRAFAVLQARLSLERLDGRWER